MTAKTELLAEYPSPRIVNERYSLDESAFQAQKLKQEGLKAEGGAIGVVWLDSDTVVLARRTLLHPGWALIGGTVEQGQTFNEAFMREVKEESGLGVNISRLVMVEQKTFVSPSGEELPMDLAVFEAEAEPGQQVQLTSGANEEGLEVKAFNINDLPQEMIMKDRVKLDEVIQSRL